MYVCNVSENELNLDNMYVKQVKEVAAKENADVVVVSAAVEAEIAQLPENDRPAFLAELGLQESGLDKVTHKGYDMLHLITFFTVNSK
jgi:ribosome-binding ATPase YchF (GTP1/OBG family)